MTAYLLAHVDVKDWNAYKEYMKHTPRVIKQYGGTFLARGGETVTLEGDEETLRIVLIEFPTLEHAKNFYYSAEYKEIKKLRAGGGSAKLVAIDGYPIEKWEADVKESKKSAVSK